MSAAVETFRGLRSSIAIVAKMAANGDKPFHVTLRLSRMGTKDVKLAVALYDDEPRGGFELPLGENAVHCVWNRDRIGFPGSVPGEELAALLAHIPKGRPTDVREHPRKRRKGLGLSWGADVRVDPPAQSLGVRQKAREGGESGHTHP